MIFYLKDLGLIEGLKLINLPADAEQESILKNVFVLKTCQRTLILGYQQYLSCQQFPFAAAELYENEDAYIFLLETICGLKSKMLGENEIVGQFKKAYGDYINSEYRDPDIHVLLEKLFKDAKKIRTDYLKNIGQQSYSGICRHLIQRESDAETVLVFGSGALAKDIIKFFSKHFKVQICARNKSRLEKIIDEYNVEVLPWERGNFPHENQVIINTIGCNNLTLFDQSYFEKWQKNHSKLWIDLGSPSVVDTELNTAAGIYRLDDIFKVGNTLNQKKEEKIEGALEAIKETTVRRSIHYTLDLHFGREDFQFA